MFSDGECYAAIAKVRRGELLPTIYIASDDLIVFNGTPLTPDDLIATMQEMVVLAPLEGPLDDLRRAVANQALLPGASSTRTRMEVGP